MTNRQKYILIEIKNIDNEAFIECYNSYLILKVIYLG